MRVVLDANVVLAAFGFGGLCRSVVEVCIEDHELVFSEHLLGEVYRGLTDKFSHSAAMADDRLALLRAAATIVAPVEVAGDACRDPDDLPVLGTIVAARADCLVTGDRDLLDLGAFEGHRILTPRAFWERLRGAGDAAE